MRIEKIDIKKFTKVFNAKVKDLEIDSFLRNSKNEAFYLKGYGEYFGIKIYAEILIESANTKKGLLQGVIHKNFNGVTETDNFIDCYGLGGILPQNFFLFECFALNNIEYEIDLMPNHENNIKILETIRHKDDKRNYELFAAEYDVD